jgi:serine protease Do
MVAIMPAAPMAVAGFPATAIFPAEPQEPTPPVVRTPETPMAFAYGFNTGGYLGIETGNVTSENASKLGLSEPRGVVIEQVIADSPASRAGLQKDDVILQFEGEDVSSVRKLTRLIGEVAPDHKVRMRISRGGREQDVTATLAQRKGGMAWSGDFGAVGKRYAELGQLGQLNADEAKKLQEQLGKMRIEGFGSGQNFVWGVGGGRRVGISTVSLTKQLAEFFGVPGGQGVLITNVNENSPAAKSGLKAGDVITDVEGEKINDSGDVTRGINKKAEGDVTFTVIRDRGQRMITVTPEKRPTEYNLQNGRLLRPSVMVAPRIRTTTPGVAPRVMVTPGARVIRRTTVIL